MRKYFNCHKEYWDFFLDFYMSAAQIDPSNKKIGVLAMEVEPVTATDPKNWK